VATVPASIAFASTLCGSAQSDLHLQLQVAVKPQKEFTHEALHPISADRHLSAVSHFRRVRRSSTKQRQQTRSLGSTRKLRDSIHEAHVAALEKIWADDSVFVNASGEVLTKEQNLANIKSGATELDTMIEEDGMTVRVYQNSAVTTTPVTIKGQYSGQHVNGLYRSTLFWVKGPAGWQLVCDQLTTLPAK
jgi:ketosteroid isomerase-like protein